MEEWKACVLVLAGNTVSSSTSLWREDMTVSM